jgi:dihydropteroate synthase
MTSSATVDLSLAAGPGQRAQPLGQRRDLRVPLRQLVADAIKDGIDLVHAIAAHAHGEAQLAQISAGQGPGRQVEWRSVGPGRQQGIATTGGDQRDAGEDGEAEKDEEDGHPPIVPRSATVTLRLGTRTFGDCDLLVMGILNRTPDSFYDRGASYAFDAALDAAARLLAEGADILDVGGVKAGPGDDVDAVEEIRRVGPFIEALRDRHPDALISVDTWRFEVGAVACAVGADLVNDAWGGVDPRLAEVAAAASAGLVCTHAGGATPRTRPHRVAYEDVVADVLERTLALAERAVTLGVARESILVDPGHDFGKNTWHSLQVTRRLGELVATGWPVLVSLSNKDFVGETLDLPVGERLIGTLATTAVSAWLGARVFRAHNVRETRQVLDMVASIRGDRPPAVARRGLA